MQGGGCDGLTNKMIEMVWTCQEEVRIGACSQEKQGIKSLLYLLFLFVEVFPKEFGHTSTSESFPLAEYHIRTGSQTFLSSILHVLTLQLLYWQNLKTYFMSYTLEYSMNRNRSFKPKNYIFKYTLVSYSLRIFQRTNLSN